MAVVVSEGAIVGLERPWNPWAGPGQSITSYSGLTETYAAIYRSQPNVRLCVRFLGRNIAQLNLKAYRRISDVERQELDRNHQLVSTIRQPNPRTTRHRFVRAIVEDRAIYDNAYVVKLRNPASGRLRLFRMPPERFRPVGDNWLYPEEYEYCGSTGQQTFPASQVIHLLGHNPADTRVGVSAMEALRRVLAEDSAAGEWREQYWRGAARMSGWIQRPSNVSKWSDPARERFKADWNATWTGSGPGAGGTPILEEGMEFKEAGFSAKDSEYLGARRLSREECAAAFFIPPVFVGILENANFSNMKEQHKSLYQDTLGPWLDEMEEDLELQLIPEFPDSEDVYVQFNIAEKLRGSFEEESTSTQVATGAPWLTRNEARARQNLPPIEGGDALVTPLNVLVGGQASPRDSAPPPAGALARRAGRKAVADLPPDVRGWVAKHQEVLADYFGRQHSAIRSRLGAGQDLDDAWNDERWDGELTDTLAGLSTEMANEIASAVAEQFGGTYDGALAAAWILANAAQSAGGINTATKQQIASVWDPEVDDALDDVADVFGLAAGARGEEIAVTRAAQVGNFARQEGASQAGAGQKVWVVNSARSRHPEMNGETVPIGETFSNGARWPGDSSLPVDETAGCTCTLNFTS